MDQTSGGGTGAVEIRTHDDDLVCFDGRVLECFDRSNIGDSWRVHVLHVAELVVKDHGRDTFRVDVVLSKRSVRPLVFRETDRARVEALMQRLVDSQARYPSV